MILPLVPLFFLQGCCCPGGGDEEPPPDDDTVGICCEDDVIIEISTELIATFEDISTCGCTFFRDEVPLTYNESSPAGEPRWDSDSDPITDCGGLEVAPVRFGNDVDGCISFFRVRFQDGPIDDWAEFSRSCDPFQWVFLSTDGCIQVTVTEAA